MYAELLKEDSQVRSYLLENQKDVEGQLPDGQECGRRVTPTVRPGSSC